MPGSALAMTHPRGRPLFQSLSHWISDNDGFNEAYIIFFLLGVGFLLPWNAFITAIDYFSFLYPNAHVGSIFSITYMVTCMASLILLLTLGGRVSPPTRILLGFCAFALLMLSMPAIDFVLAQTSSLLSSDLPLPPPTAHPSPSSPPHSSPLPAVLSAGMQLAGLAATVAAVSLCGVVDASVQGSLFGMAGRLHESFTQALEGGTSASGMFVSLLRLLCKALLPATPLGLRRSAAVYFSLVALLLGACVAAFLRLEHVPWVAARAARRLRPLEAAEGGGAGGASLPAGACAAASGREAWREAGASVQQAEQAAPHEGTTRVADAPRELHGRPSTGPSASPSSGREVLPSLLQTDGETAALLESLTEPSGLHCDSATAAPPPASDKAADVTGLAGLRTLQQIWKYAAGVTLVYVVTLCLFPGYVTELQSQALGSWFPVLLTTCFNLADFVGKMLPAWAPAAIAPPGGLVSDVNVDVLLSWTVARIPAFFLSFVGVNALLPNSPLRDGIFILAILLFGFSNGLLTSCLMMAAPTKVEEKSAETAGIMMVFFLVTGLLLGSLLSWALVGI